MKYVLPLFIVACAVAGMAVWLLTDHLLPGLGLTAVALVLWAVAPPTVGRPGGFTHGAGNADPRRVKEYRSKHPGATISDAIRATRP